MTMDMIAILVMANVRLFIIINVLVLPSDKTSFIYFSENVNDVSTKNENASSSIASNKRKRVHVVSSKL